MLWSQCYPLLQTPYKPPLSPDTKSQNQIICITHKPVAFESVYTFHKRPNTVYTVNIDIRCVKYRKGD